MSQQINLFNPALITKRSILSGMNIMLSSLVLVVLMVCLWGGLTWRLRQIQSIESSSFAQMQSLDAQFNQLQVELKMPVHDPVLAGRLTDLQNLLKQRQDALTVLSKGNFGSTVGASNIMVAFAKQIPDGVWLTGFDFDSESNAVSIRGRALQADSVPLFVTQLKREKAMSGRAFAALDLRRPADESDQSSNNEKQKQLAPFIEFEMHTIEPKEKAIGVKGND